MDQIDSPASAQLVVLGTKANLGWRSFLLIGALIVIAALLGTLIARRFETKPAPAQVIRTEYELPSDQFPSGDARTPCDLTRWHKAIYVAKQKLYLRPLDSLESVAIVGTDGANTPFFLLTGNGSGLGEQIKKVALTGGAPIQSVTPKQSGSWG